jgi:hypothetical protein
MPEDHLMKAYVGLKVEFHTFLTAIIVEGE